MTFARHPGHLAKKKTRNKFAIIAQQIDEQTILRYTTWTIAHDIHTQRITDALSFEHHTTGTVVILKSAAAFLAQNSINSLSPRFLAWLDRLDRFIIGVRNGFINPHVHLPPIKLHRLNHNRIYGPKRTFQPWLNNPSLLPLKPPSRKSGDD